MVGFTSAAVGYAHPYFHAAKDGTVPSGHSAVLEDENDDWEYGSIEELVESRLDDPQRTTSERSYRS